MTKRTNHQEDKIILNLYASSNMISSVYKEKLIFKEEMTNIQLYNPHLSGKSSKDTENNYSIQAPVEQNKNWPQSNSQQMPKNYDDIEHVL